MEELRDWVRQFFDHELLVGQTVAVLSRLPEEVRVDLTCDPGFVMNLIDTDVPGPVTRRLGRLTAGAPARSVTLKLSLARREPEFAAYVIAHEFAHAYLRNVCRCDAEADADELAAVWGFPAPPMTTGVFARIRESLRISRG